MSRIDVYLACPYSHKDHRIRELRYRKATDIAARISAAGLTVFSPLTHCHPLAVLQELPGDWEYWQRFDRAILSVCACVQVITLHDWKRSAGIKAEIEIARDLGLPVYAHPVEEIEARIAIGALFEGAL